MRNVTHRLPPKCVISVPYCVKIRGTRTKKNPGCVIAAQ